MRFQDTEGMRRGAMIYQERIFPSLRGPEGRPEVPADHRVKICPRQILHSRSAPPVLRQAQDGYPAPPLGAPLVPLAALFVTITVFFSSIVSLAIAQEIPQTELSLDQVITEALANNPEIREARARWEAARKWIPQSWALPDPMAGFSVMGPDMFETRLGPQEEMYEVEQEIPFPAKLAQRRRIASAEARAAQASLRAAERDVLLEVAQVYYDLFTSDQIIAVVTEIQSILKKFEAIAQSRYASGGGSQRDVAKAQVEVSETIERLFMLRQQRETLAALLNSLLDRNAASSIGKLAQPFFPQLSIEMEELLELAKSHRPELEEAEAMLQRSEHERTLAKLEYFPDVTVGFRYIQIGSGTTAMANDGQDSWMIPLKFTLPIWQNRIVPGIQEAKSQAQASRSKLSWVENRTEYEVKDAYYRFTTAGQIVELYENALIPEAELAFRSDQAGYEAGTQDILNLIDSERVYLNAKVAQYQSAAEALKSFAQLERAVGGELPGKDEGRRTRDERRKEKEINGA